MHVMRSFNPTFVPEDHSTFNEIYPVNSGAKNIVSAQPFKFTLACSNCQGKCLRILRKSIGQKVAEVCFVWHQDTLFQPNDILVGTSLL